MHEIREVPSDHPDFTALQSDAVWDYQQCLVAYCHSQPQACLTYHLDQHLAGTSEPTGVVGHYEAESSEAGRAVLRDALVRLTSLGAKSVLGPINGNIWSRFRFAQPGHQSPFFLEPTNPENYIQDFLSVGFTEDTVYQSRIIEKLQQVKEPSVIPPDNLRERYFDLSQAESELRKLYEVSTQSFSDHLYHRPISCQAFLAMHLPLLEKLDPELLPILEAPDGSIAAFLLAYPDFLTPSAGRLVAKTLGVLPTWRRMKLGTYLVARIHQIAVRKGFQSLIHALFQVDNPSNSISAAQMALNGRLFRSYSLYRWEKPDVA